MKSKSFVRGSAALLATLTLMSGKASAMQPVMQPVLQQPMMQPVMYPVQQFNVKEQMMLQNNTTDNQIALQNNNADNTIKVQDNYFERMKEYRDSDPFLKWVFYTFVGTAVATFADMGAGAYATWDPWWLFDGTEGDAKNIKAAKDRGHEQMYNVASKVAGAVGCIWAGIFFVLKIAADAVDTKKN